MQKFFIVVSVLVTLFTAGCIWTDQPKETSALNLLNMLLSFELIKLYGKKEEVNG